MKERKERKTSSKRKAQNENDVHLTVATASIRSGRMKTGTMYSTECLLRNARNCKLQ